MRIAVFFLFLLAVPVRLLISQGLPGLQSVDTIFLSGIGNFELFPDSKGANVLYVKPQNLKIASDQNGKPLISVVLLKEIVGRVEAERLAQSNAYGYIFVSCYLGYDNQEKVFDKLRAKLEGKNSQYKSWHLTSISFEPGTGKLGYSVLDSSKVIWVPVPAPTTIGSSINIMIPITKEHGEIILRKLEDKPQGQSLDLGINLHYQAEATFDLPPTSMWVEASKEQIFKYFHETLKIGGGFWIFSWSYHRETIRQEMEKKGYLKGDITFGGERTQALLEKYKINLADLFREAKARAVDFVADIQVDTTGKVPSNSYEKREGRITIFSPCFFWSFTAWAGGSYGKIDMDIRARGMYREELTFHGQANVPIALAQDNVPLDRSIITIVDLEHAFYVVDTLQVEPFASDNPKVWGNWVNSAKVFVNIGKADSNEQYVFHFNQNKCGTQASGYWRNTRFEIKDGVLTPTLPPLFVSTQLNTAQWKFSTKSIDTPYNVRSHSRFQPAIIDLNDFYGLVEIHAELLFSNEKIKVVEVEYLRPGISSGTEVLTLTSDKPFAYALFYKSQGTHDASIHTRVYTQQNRGQWGPIRSVAGSVKVYLVLSDVTIP